jgi:hypothetical protein
MPSDNLNEVIASLQAEGYREVKQIPSPLTTLVETLRAELPKATLSSSDKDICIQCSDYETRDAIFDALDALGGDVA